MPKIQLWLLRTFSFVCIHFGFVLCCHDMMQSKKALLLIGFAFSLNASNISYIWGTRTSVQTAPPEWRSGHIIPHCGEIRETREAAAADSVCNLMLIKEKLWTRRSPSVWFAMFQISFPSHSPTGCAFTHPSMDLTSEASPVERQGLIIKFDAVHWCNGTLSTNTVYYTVYSVTVSLQSAPARKNK